MEALRRMHPARFGAVFCFLVGFTLAPLPVLAGDHITINASDYDIAARFAPVLYLSPGEVFWPTEIRAMLDHSSLWSNSTLVADPPVSEQTLLDQNGVSASLRLALNGQTPHEAYRSYRDVYRNVTYARVAHRADGSVIVQYWLFYFFNDGLNDHEGDWEMVQVHLNPDLLPQWATYSQHTTGRVRHWSEVPRVGSHPEVYVANGSHASYFSTGNQPLASDPCGFTGIDATSGALALFPEIDYRIDVISNETWLAFEGRWGAPGSFEFTSGPRGPRYRSNGCGVSLWDDPSAWSSSLPVERAGPWVASYDAPPSADAGADRTAFLGDHVELNASRSRDSDGSIVRYSWDFGDGLLADGPVVRHRYAASGTYVATLVVTDDAALSAADSTTVTIIDPVVNRGTNATVLDGLPPPPPFDYRDGPAPPLLGSPLSWSWSVLVITEIILIALLARASVRAPRHRARKP